MEVDGAEVLRVASHLVAASATIRRAGGWFGTYGWDPFLWQTGRPPSAGTVMGYPFLWDRPPLILPEDWPSGTHPPSGRSTDC